MSSGVAPPTWNPITQKMEGGCTPHEPHYPAPAVYKQADSSPLMPSPGDPVNHPKHYNKGKIEVADFIADQDLNFDRGNAVKYICRAGDKLDLTMPLEQKEIQDLEKAIWYIKHEIKMIKERNGLSR